MISWKDKHSFSYSFLCSVTLTCCLWLTYLRKYFLIVSVLGGMPFGFRMRIKLITYWRYSCCWEVHTESRALGFSCCPTNTFGVHKERGGDTGRTADLNRPLGHPVSYGSIVVTNKTEEVGWVASATQVLAVH